MTLLLALLFCTACLMAFALFVPAVAGSITLIWAGSPLIIPLAYAVPLATLAVLALVYIAQLTDWLASLADRWRGAQAKRGTALLTAAWAAYMVGDAAGAAHKLKTAQPKLRSAEHPLASLLKLNLADEETEVATHATDTVLGAAAGLRLAQIAAKLGNWENVLAATTPALAQSPASTHLLTLHFKALLNTGSTAAAITLLPEFKSRVSAKTWSLLQLAVKGREAGTPATNNPWLRMFETWLATTSMRLPEA